MTLKLLGTLNKYLGTEINNANDETVEIKV